MVSSQGMSQGWKIEHGTPGDIVAEMQIKNLCLVKPARTWYYITKASAAKSSAGQKTSLHNLMLHQIFMLEKGGYFVKILISTIKKYLQEEH